MSNKILRFTSSTCAPCRVMAKNIEEAKLDIPVEVVDIDVHPEIAKEYGIRSIPTLVMKKEGVESKLIGLQTVTKIKLWALE